MLLSKRRVTPSIEPFPRSSERRQRSTCCSDIITDRRAANVHVNELKDPFKHRPDHPAGESVLMTDECLVLKEETTCHRQTAESWQCEVHFLTLTDSVWHLILFFFFAAFCRVHLTGRGYRALFEVSVAQLSVRERKQEVRCAHPSLLSGRRVQSTVFS